MLHTYKKRKHLHSWTVFLSKKGNPHLTRKVKLNIQGVKLGKGGIVYQAIKAVFGFILPKMWVTIIWIWGWMMYCAG